MRPAPQRSAAVVKASKGVPAVFPRRAGRVTPPSAVLDGDASSRRGRRARMRIAVIGTGYVGLVAGVCFADAGFDVVCVDTDAKKVARLLGGDVVIYEPGLAEMMHRAQREKRLAFTASHAGAVAGAAVVFVAVGTPEGKDGAPDLSYVDAALADVGRALTGPAIVVLKSTVPVGTAARARSILAK